MKGVPGYDDTMSRHQRPMTGLERSLYKLNAVRELGEWANEFIELDAVEEDDGNDGTGIFLTADKNQSKADPELQETIPSIDNNVDDDDFDDDEEVVPTFFAQPCVTSVPNSAVAKRQDSVIVIIRHGKTQVRKCATT